MLKANSRRVGVSTKQSCMKTRKSLISFRIGEFIPHNHHLRSGVCWRIHESCYDSVHEGYALENTRKKREKKEKVGINKTGIPPSEGFQVSKRQTMILNQLCYFYSISFFKSI